MNQSNHLEDNEIFIPPSCHVQPMSRHSEKWNKMFYALVKFRRENGHCLVPNRYRENPQLGLWVAVQRRQYRQFQRKERTVMTAGRVSLLESIGFKWALKDPDHVPWDTRFQELQKYRKQHGDCLVPLGYKANPQLSVWVMLQRDAYKMKMEGKAEDIEDYQVMKLDSIGFIWNTEDELSGRNQVECDNDVCNDLDRPEITTEIIRDTCNQPNEHGSETSPLNLPVFQIPQECIDGTVLSVPCLPAAKNFSPGQMKTLRISMDNRVHVELARSQYRNMNLFAQMHSIENIARMSLAQSMLQMQSLTRQGFPQLPYPHYSNFAYGNLPSVTKGGYCGQAMNSFLLRNSGKMNASSTLQDPRNQQKNVTKRNIITSTPSTRRLAHSALDANNCINDQVCRNVSQEELIGVNRRLDLSNTSISSSSNHNKTNGRVRLSVTRKYPGPQTSDAFWWSRFAELQKFREINGHCFVPNRYPVHPALGNWVSTQRRTYKLWKKKKSSSMNKERARALESIGFSWDATRSSSIGYNSETF